MSITIVNTETEFDTLAAWRIIGEIMKNPAAVIGLSTGRTTTNMHRLVARIYQQYPFDVSGITLFPLDEITNIPRNFPGSCYAMLKDQIVDALGLKESQFPAPPTESDDFERECRQYEQELADRGGIDFLVLGLGANGHLGFNQPGTPFESVTWISRMDEALEVRIRRESHTPADKALGGFTLGISNIMHAKKIMLVAKGVEKANIVKEMLQGKVTPDIPASVLQLHPDCEFILDAEAAKFISL